MMLDIVRLTLFPTLMAFAAASDLLTMTISNRISLLLVAGFVLLAALSGTDIHEVVSHLGAGATVLAVAFGCFAMGWIGGGDAKLVAAIALWFGFGHLMDYLVYASIGGGALTFTVKVTDVAVPSLSVAMSVKLSAPLKLTGAVYCTSTRVLKGGADSVGC